MGLRLDTELHFYIGIASISLSYLVPSLRSSCPENLVQKLPRPPAVTIFSIVIKVAHVASHVSHSLQKIVNFPLHFRQFSSPELSKKQQNSFKYTLLPTAADGAAYSCEQCV